MELEPIRVRPELQRACANRPQIYSHFHGSFWSKIAFQDILKSPSGADIHGQGRLSSRHLSFRIKCLYSSHYVVLRPPQRTSGRLQRLTEARARDRKREREGAVPLTGLPESSTHALLWDGLQRVVIGWIGTFASHIHTALIGWQPCLSYFCTLEKGKMAEWFCVVFMLISS